MPTTITKTVKSAGGDYTSLQSALSGEARDLTAADQIAVFECYSMADTSAACVLRCSMPTALRAK